jgi:hypothetical protein
MTEQNNAPAPASAPEFRYKILTDKATRLAKGTENLARCSILQVKERVAAASPVSSAISSVVVTASAPASASAPAPASVSRFPFNISFPFLNGVMPKDYRT